MPRLEGLSIPGLTHSQATTLSTSMRLGGMSDTTDGSTYGMTRCATVAAAESRRVRSGFLSHWFAHSPMRLCLRLEPRLLGARFTQRSHVILSRLSCIMVPQRTAQVSVFVTSLVLGYGVARRRLVTS